LDTPQSICCFGIARGDVTPPMGIYHRMWGAATHDRATGVHRPLTATAMVFQAAQANPQGDAEQILVAVDHCLLWAREMEALLDLAARTSGVPRERIAVTFSHTHASGLMGLERKDFPGGELIAWYLDLLGARIGDLIVQARKSAGPVNITYGTGRCN